MLCVFFFRVCVCVQFQKAKLAFEEKLVQAGEAGEIGYSIVRPTAFFKSVSGQLEVISYSCAGGTWYFMAGYGMIQYKA